MPGVRDLAGSTFDPGVIKFQSVRVNFFMTKCKSKSNIDFFIMYHCAYINRSKSVAKFMGATLAAADIGFYA